MNIYTFIIILLTLIFGIYKHYQNVKKELKIKIKRLQSNLKKVENENLNSKGKISLEIIFKQTFYSNNKIIKEIEKKFIKQYSEPIYESSEYIIRLYENNRIVKEEEYGYNLDYDDEVQLIYYTDFIYDEDKNTSIRYSKNVVTEKWEFYERDIEYKIKNNKSLSIFEDYLSYDENYNSIKSLTTKFSYKYDNNNLKIECYQESDNDDNDYRIIYEYDNGILITELVYVNNSKKKVIDTNKNNLFKQINYNYSNNYLASKKTIYLKGNLKGAEYETYYLRKQENMSILNQLLETKIDIFNSLNKQDQNIINILDIFRNISNFKIEVKNNSNEITVFLNEKKYD